MANNPDQELAAETSQKHPGGRPTDYKPEYAEQARKLCHLGATDDEIADFFDVHRATVYRWKHDFPEFCDAIKAGKDIADERVERSLYQMATGYTFRGEQAIKVKRDQYLEEVEVVEVARHKTAETPAAIFWLKNRRKDQWRDKIETSTELSGPNGKPMESITRIELVAPTADDISSG